MSQNRAFIGPGLPDATFRAAGQHRPDQTPKKNLLSPHPEFKGMPRKYFNSSYSRPIQLGKVWSRSKSSHTQIWGQQNLKSCSLSDISHYTRDVK